MSIRQVTAKCRMKLYRKFLQELFILILCCIKLKTIQKTHSEFISVSGIVRFRRIHILLVSFQIDVSRFVVTLLRQLHWTQAIIVLIKEENWRKDRMTLVVYEYLFMMASDLGLHYLSSKCKYPGQLLPLYRSTRTCIDEHFMFGDHYAKTLEYWRLSFERSWENIKQMGFNNTFRRMWDYYLSYCQGGFQSGNINVGQFLIKKI